MALGLSLARLTLSASPLAFAAGSVSAPVVIQPATPLFSEDFSTYAVNTLIAEGSDPHIVNAFTPVSSTANLATLYWKRPRVAADGTITFGTTSPSAAGADGQNGSNNLGTQLLLRDAAANHWFEFERAGASMDVYAAFAATTEADTLSLHVNDFGIQVYQVNGTGTQLINLSASSSSTSRQAWARQVKNGDRFRGLSYGSKAYAYRNGVSLQPAGVAHTRTGTKFGWGSYQDFGRRTDNWKADIAPGRLAIVNDGAYANTNNWRFYARKKDISAAYPKGYADVPCKLTYEDFASGLAVQWALFDPGTDAQLTAWADPVPLSTVSGGGNVTFLARVPAGIETTLLGADRRTGYPYPLTTTDGRTLGAGQLPYSIGFRAIVANKDSGVWIRSRQYFAVAANIVLTGQSNGFNQQNNSTANVPDHPGCGQYAATYTPSTVTPVFGAIVTGWDQSTTEQVAGGFDKCSGWYQLVADALGVPVMTTNVCVSATGAATHNPEAGDYAGNWIRDALQQVKYFEHIIIDQGENEINTSTTGPALAWRAQWRDINIPNIKAYANQPAGTQILVGVVISGKYTSTPAYGAEPTPSSVLRKEQEALAATAGYYPASHPVGLTLADATVHFDGTDTGYPARVRQNALSVIKAMLGTGYNGLGPLITTATRSGATVTLPVALNGAASLTSSTGTLTGLTGWRANLAANMGGSAIAVSAAVLDAVAQTVTLTLASDPGGPVYLDNYASQNPDESNRVVGTYSNALIGTIHAKPIVTPIRTST